MNEKIVKLISELKPYELIDENTTLISSGMLNSLSILALVTMIEDEFGVEIPNDDITRENFDSVDVIAGLITKITEGKVI